MDILDVFPDLDPSEPVVIGTAAEVVLVLASLNILGWLGKLLWWLL